MVTPARGVLLGLAEWTLGIRRAEVKPSAFPGSLGQETEGPWSQVMGRWTGCVVRVESAFRPSSFPACVWNHAVCPAPNQRRSQFI